MRSSCGGAHRAVLAKTRRLPKNPALTAAQTPVEFGGVARVSGYSSRLRPVAVYGAVMSSRMSQVVRCPRCGRQFTCQAGTGRVCHCSEIRLTPEQRENIALRWNGCLCHDCLLTLSMDSHGSVSD
jgi:hypothetical protein